ncbi:hypothetical protein CON70_27505 [Bacillus pseudomycoides]|uniref:thioredoxin family protein n=1 Tax=Bacillus pseudomycoides TaxID=64104 RepID=UPI000BEE0040|nr:thioredoxin family protein [Bacillus pseudomycoides]PDZ08484.1 hypothetical protein CON70_27505 [Bacillus pseudomycoides]
MKKYIVSVFVILITFGISIYVYGSSVNNEHGYKDISFEKYTEKLNNNHSFFLYVYRTGCSACQELEPTLNKVIKEREITIDSIEMSKNRDNHKDYFVEHNIDSTPMLIHYKNGKEDARLSNQVITEKKLNEFLSEHSDK